MYPLLNSDHHLMNTDTPHDHMHHHMPVSSTVSPEDIGIVDDSVHKHIPFGDDQHGAMQHMMSMAVIMKSMHLFRKCTIFSIHLQFHFGYNETILFNFWQIDTVLGLIGSMIAIFVMATLYEGLKYYREYLFWKTYNLLEYRPVSMPEKGSEEQRPAPTVQ